MATARCYTKSGNIEKYESNLWQHPGYLNWSYSGISGTITTPDSNGNYTVTPEQSFEDSSDTTTYSCFTEYGGVKKTFYFKKKNTSITGWCQASWIYDQTTGDITVTANIYPESLHSIEFELNIICDAYNTSGNVIDRNLTFCILISNGIGSNTQKIKIIHGNTFPSVTSLTIQKSKTSFIPKSGTVNGIKYTCNFNNSFLGLE